MITRIPHHEYTGTRRTWLFYPAYFDINAAEWVMMPLPLALLVRGLRTINHKLFRLSHDPCSKAASEVYEAGFAAGVIAAGKKNSEGRSEW